MNFPANTKFSLEHEWVVVDGEIATIGITDFAQQQLGDIVFVEVETLDDTIMKGEIFGTVEAVKTVSDLYMPISGKILEINPKLESNPEIVNKDPYGEGWIIKVKFTKPDELKTLLDYDAYKAHIS